MKTIDRTGCWRRYGQIGAILVVGLGLFGRLANTASADVVPTVLPKYVPVFPGSDTVQAAVFAPDRPSVYVLSHVQRADVWPALVALWPELLGGGVALATVALAVVYLRLRQRPRIAGTPYCRRCNYDLTPQVRTDETAEKPRMRWEADARCPECGTVLDAAHPVPGRTFGRRIAPALVLWGIAVLGYAMLFAGGTSRTGSAASMFSLSSAWAAENANSWMLIWLKLSPATHDQLIEFDLMTGAPVRSLVERASNTDFAPTVTPDGTVIFLSRVGSDGIDAISTKTGEIVSSVRLRGSPPIGREQPCIIGFTPDGTGAYLQTVDWQLSSAELDCWYWKKHAGLEQLFRVLPEQGSKAAGLRSFVLRDHRGEGGAPRFYSLPDFAESFQAPKCVVMLHEGSQPHRNVELAKKPFGMQPPQLGPDGSTLYVVSGFGQSLDRVDLETGAVIKQAAGKPVSAEPLPERENGIFLMLPSKKGAIFGEVSSQQWNVALDAPSGMMLTSSELSQDGRWICAMGIANPMETLLSPKASPPKASPPKPQLIIWDLGEHRYVGSGAKPAAADPPSGVEMPATGQQPQKR